MAEGRGAQPGRLMRRLSGLLLVSGIVVALGCEGDTLYDTVAPDVEPPVVEILTPATGSQVQAGQRVPIRVAADDEQGVSSITLRITGLVNQSIYIQFAPPRPSVQADTAIVVPLGSSGSIQIAASGVNTKGLEGQASDVSLSVTDMDFLPPWVSLSVEAAPRMEMTDEIRVIVRSFDNPGGSGIVRTALTAIVSNTSRSDTLVLSPSDDFVGEPSDTAVSEYAFTPPHVDSLALPDTLRVLFFGLAYDAEGNCSGAVDEEFTNQVACDTVFIAGGEHVIASAVAEPREVIAVSGRTSLAPGSGVLADLLVDTPRSKVYVSNLSRNRIQTLETGTGSWLQDVWVGAEPWGLAMNARGDSLMVANSGGTSISFVSLTGEPREDLDRRFVTQNNALWEVELTSGKLVSLFHDFSDRPQFIAQDAEDRILFSTRPTDAAVTGTVRQVINQPSWDVPETKILAFADDLVPSPTTTAIIHVDSVYTGISGGFHCVQIWDHKPGFPGTVVTSGCQDLQAALDSMTAHRNAGNSDFWYASGFKWELERLAMEDTTFVAASGDREWVAFGEGGTAETDPGRITLWHSATARIHGRLLVSDLVNNASERVTGLDLNLDGSLGSASGDDASYFWSTDLRLQGSITKTPTGGAGAVLHPDHPSFSPDAPSSEQTLSFVGQADNTVRILDTAHFTERGQIHIRDNIVGPLRAAPPLATDNDGTGGACSGENCVVVKLYGITDAGGVVVVDVRRRDIITLQ
ncbi:MAG: YncE family protein [Longimicrobiales bacterium]